MTGATLLFFSSFDVLILDGIRPSRLLVSKVRRIQIETGNWALHAEIEELDVPFKEMAVNPLSDFYKF